MNTPVSAFGPEGEQAQTAQDVIQFWRDAGPDKWFRKDDDFDALFRSRFYDLHFAAARRELEDWKLEPEACLALVILLDQYPRNSFRGCGHMFATDPLARAYATHFIESGYLPHIEEALRLFVCVPFIHSEDLGDQEYAVVLYEEHAPQGLSFAIDHRDIIAQFGRFPHRNESLGRVTTEAEQAFLNAGGFAG